MIRILLVDDHPIITEALRTVFVAERGFEVVGVCRSGSECLSLVRARTPSVVVLDLSMPGMSGLDVLRELNELAERPRVVLWTAAFDHDEVMAAIRLGVCGIVLKQMDPSALVECVRRSAEAPDAMDRASINRALQALHDDPHHVDHDALSPREVEILRLLSRGLSNKEIGSLLAISSETVKTHVRHIYEKLRLANRAELGVVAKERGYV